MPDMDGLELCREVRLRLSESYVYVLMLTVRDSDSDMLKGLNFPNAMPVKVAAQKTLNLSARTGEHYLKITHRVAFSIIRSIPSFIFRRLKV